MADRPSKDRKTAVEVAEQAASEGHVTGEQPRVTVAEGDRPGQVESTAPGDAPADTWDARERVSTVIPSGDVLAEASVAGVGAVVSHVKTGEAGQRAERDSSDDRWEEYDVQGVTVRHNLDTGESVRA